MNQIAAYAIAAAAIVGVTIYDGLRWERWGARDPAELDRFVKLLEHIPNQVGDWDSEPAPSDPVQIAAAEIRGNYSRIFHNRRTGAKVNVFLVCGKTKPIIDHSPDQCYAAAGYDSIGEAHREPIPYGETKGEFKRGRFGRDTALDREQVEVLWGFTHDGIWTAPTNPRMTFANFGALYKLYVINPPQPAIDGTSASAAFLKDFLPIVDRHLFQVPVAESQGETAEQPAAEAA
jgi:hypothetical protein